MTLFKRKKNFVIWTSYILLFSVLVFVSVISIIYKNTYKVNAQIDIQTISPTTPVSTETSDEQRGTSAKFCINPDTLENKRRVGNIIVGQFQGLWYATNEDRDLSERNVLNNLEEVRRQTDARTWSNTWRSSGLSSRGRINAITKEITSKRSSRCPIGLTGVSPTIFTYSPNTKVQPLAPILYLEQNNQYIYYEYDGTNVSFNKPKQGWIIDKEKLETFSKDLSNKLRLTPLESERLLFELNFSASDVKSDKLFIGLIPQSEVDSKLPLEVSSPNNPKVIRYHFYVAEAKKENIQAPKLAPIQRDTPFILEFGSFAKN